MDSGFSEIPLGLKNETSALCLMDVRMFLEKRRIFLENFQTEKNFKNKKTQHFEKILEYAQRFSNSKTIEHQKVESMINQLKKKNDESKDYVRIEIFICKILDLNPKNYEESIHLMPGIEKFLQYKDIKFFFGQ